MNKIVVKFGGSNLKKKDDILRIVQVVKLYNRPLVIVVSALYGITNRLIEILHGSLEDEDLIRQFSDMILELKKDILDQLVSNEEQRSEILKNLEVRVNRLEKYLKGVHYIGEIPPSVEDTVLSYGERMSALLISSILSCHGINCQEALPEDIGLVTDGEHGNSSVDFDASAPLVSEALKEDKVFIVPGFYGVSPTGKVTLFGRGGSDYTAAAIGRCLEAESVDVWKDVEGFRTADPGIVSGTQVVGELSYQEAAELAYFGAKILHPRTVEPLSDLQIPVRVLNIDAVPLTVTPVSLIQGNTSVSEHVVKCVSYTDDVAVVKVSGPGIGIKPGIVSRITTAFEHASVNIKSIITSQTSINFLIAPKDLNRCVEIVNALHQDVISRITPVKDIALVAVVGEGLLEHHGILAKVLNAVSQDGINVMMNSLGASDVAAYFIVSQEDKIKALSGIHSAFFS